MEGTSSISILLPVRDAAKTLDACLVSLVEQTWTDWECLAIDDHSTDGSRAILERWARRDRRIHVLEAPDPGGIVASLEEGRREAQGPLVARQDADDRSHPTRLARQIGVMVVERELSVLGCLTRGPAAATGGMRRYLDWLADCTEPETCAREIWIEAPIAHPTAMARATVLREVGGYREAGWPEDYDLWLRIHRAGGRLRSLPEVLYDWSDSPGRLSRRDRRYSPEAFLRCRVHHLRRWLSERAVRRPLVIWGAGRDGRRLARAWGEEIARPGPAAGPIVAFIDIDPRKIGRQRMGKPVVAAEDLPRDLGDSFVLAAVGVAGARELIRERLRAVGFREGRDFLSLH